MSNLENLTTHLLKMTERFKSYENFYNNNGRNILSNSTCDTQICHTWIYFTDRVTELFARSIPKVDLPSNPKTVLASICYKKWQEAVIERDSGYSDCFVQDETNSHYGKHQIPVPKPKELLQNYIYRIRDDIEGKRKIHFWYKRNLTSFLCFLRQNRPHEEVAFIEHILPKDMELRPYSLPKEISSGKFEDFPCHVILRKILPNVYPIGIKAASKILQKLAEKAIKGRINGRLANLEVLGMCLVFLSASRLRVPMQVKDFEFLTISSIDLDNSTLKIPTYFGLIDLPISKDLTKYLSLLAEISSEVKDNQKIFQSSQRTRERTFQATVKSCELNLGPITFQTFLSHPHYSGETRYQPKPSA